MKRAAVASMLALIVLLASGIYGARSTSTKPGQGPLAEEAGVGDAPPIPGETLAATPPPFTVPAASHSGRCPRRWSAFENPVGHYRFCYPPGWGFSELDRPSPLEELRSVTLGTLRLLSPESFPWKVGERVSDAIVERAVVALELNVVPATGLNDPDNPTCALATRTIAGVRFQACEELLDVTGARASAGPIHILRIGVPLARVPEQTQPYPTVPSHLQVIVRSLTTTFQRMEGSIWQIAATIDAY